MAGRPVAADRARRFGVLRAPENEQQVMRALVERIAKGRTFYQVCQEVQLPYTDFLMWLQEDEDRWEAFLKAHEARSLEYVSEAVAIADSVRGAETAAQVAAAKLAVDARFRYAKHHAPKLYGDRVEVDHKGGGAALIEVVVVQDAPAAAALEAKEPAVIDVEAVTEMPAETVAAETREEQPA